MRRKLALAASFTVGLLGVADVAGAQEWWELTASGSMHCIKTAPHLICTKHGPEDSYVVPEIINRWVPGHCSVIRIRGGNNAGLPALIHFGAPGGVLDDPHNHSSFGGCMAVTPPGNGRGFCRARWVSSAVQGCHEGTEEGVSHSNPDFVVERPVGFKHSPSEFYDADIVDEVLVY